MNERQTLAAAAQSVRDAPAEPRAIDRHDGIRAKRTDRRYRFTHAAKDHRRPREHLGNAPDREIFEPNEARQPLLLHPLAADPADAKPAAGTPPQRGDQSAAERVPRRLPSDNKDEG